MKSGDFPPVFKALTGVDPFPWQEALFAEFASGRFPESANLPTGLGKTSVVAVWLCALTSEPTKVPRRLVYVVNRRTVVDQTSSEVAKWRQNLIAAGLHTDLAALLAVPLPENESPLAISTLRGQFADNREWSADPARPAVIVGTVDMIGSRLLFCGYASGFKTRPHHAALLGQDVLLIHDEAHLEPAFQQLLSAIVKQQMRDGDARQLRVMQLSATTRSTTPAFELTARDENDARVARRLYAKKIVRLNSLTDEKLLAEKLTSLALAHRDSGRAILIFARSLETVQRVQDELKKQKLGNQTRVLTGTMRGLERDRLVEHPVFQRFLPPSSRTQGAPPPAEGTVFLVATSAGEVGVNLSADDLVCDLSTFESIAQRFGRVNRFGERDDSVIDIVHPEVFDTENLIEVARAGTLQLLRQLNGDASPSALRALDPGTRAAAFSPEPEVKIVTDILFDAWSLTTIRSGLPGRPPVAPYLHGIAEWEPPETYVAWRTEAQLIDESLQIFYRPEDMLIDYPLKPHELLRDRSSRVHKQLMKLAERTKDKTLRVWLVSDDGDIEVVALADLAEKEAEPRLHECTVIIPPDAGGLSDGLLDGSAPPSETGIEDVADLAPGPNNLPLRRRLFTDEPKAPSREDQRLRLVRTIDMRRATDDGDEENEEPVSARRYWHWLETTRASDGESLYRASKSVLLEVHAHDVEQHAARIATKLALPERLRLVVTLAARFHDLGKARWSWQRGIGNATPKILLAKAGRNLRAREVGDRYRHEFGSLHDATKRPELNDLKEEERDLLLHLIAAHHGRARPHFPTDEAVDPDADLRTTQDTAGDVPRRFARLQRRYGRWGLAYLESLVRAADYAASANPSSTVEAPS